MTTICAALLEEARASHRRGSGAGVLPLLSHALDQAWRCRAGNAVTVVDYERTGGIEGAVADSAQRAYGQLTPAQQDAARQIFTRLTAISDEGLDTADSATRKELTEGRDAAQTRDVEAVLEAFAAERLLTLTAGTVELSHEVLLTAWPLLRDTWLADTRADRILRTRLHTTATEWARHDRDPSYLYHGSLLQAATDTATRISADPGRHPPLGQTERDFLHASGRARRRAAHLRQAVIAGLLVLTLIAVTTAVIAARNAASAVRQHTLALSRQLAAESLSIAATDPVTARRLAVAAWHVFPTSQAASVITTLLADQQQDGILPAAPVHRLTPWRSAPTASCWPPAARTARSGCGTQAPARPSAGPSTPPAPRAPCTRWRSAPTASCWPSAVRTGGCGCGIQPPVS